MDAGPTAPVTVTVDVGRLGVDIAAVDWLARLALLTRRHDGRLVLRDVSAELRDLIELAGLDEVLLRDQDWGRAATTRASPQQ
jgi:anti-anti-sigma regulatory factor